MSRSVLFIKSAAGERQIPLDKERLVLGRDKKCEVVLDDSAISRKHAAVLFKFGIVYIENISSTGRILKQGTAVEFCELPQGQEVQIGPYTLSWGQAAETQNPATDPSSNAFAAPSNAPGFEDPSEDAFIPKNDDVVAEVEPAPLEEDSPANENDADLGPAPSFEDQAPNDPDAPFLPAKKPGSVSLENPGGPQYEPSQFEIAQGAGPVEAQDAVESPVLNNDLGSDLDIPPSQENSVAAPEMDLDIVSPEGSTKFMSNNVAPVLKVVKGEIAGREIPLLDGVEWIVGRGAKSTVVIENAKISRQHFKIVLAGGSYRVKDLGSANGTRLNGVAISDAPLSSFDSIQAGPVEIQFLLVDAKLQKLAAGPVGITPGQTSSEANFAASKGSQGKTVFAPPMPYSVQSQNTGLKFKMPPQYGANPFGAANPNNTKSSAPKKGPFAWISSQPTGRKIAYGLLLLLLLVGLALNSMPPPPNPAATPPLPQGPVATSPNPATVSEAKDLPKPASVTAPLADNSPVGMDFDKLPPEKQAQIRELYDKAQKARAAQDWQGAYDSSHALLSEVSRYKDAAAILDEAQTHLNENSIGDISKDKKNVSDAAEENQDKLQLYIEAGDKALADQRWEDAQESYSKAFNLDPTNAKATQGMAKALAHDTGTSVNVPTAPAAVAKEDPDAEIKKALSEEFSAYKGQAVDAKKRFDNGRFGESLTLYKELDRKLTEEYPGQVNRAPATVQDSYSKKGVELQTQVREAIEASRTQLHNQYQTQLADAEEFINNKQYVQARDAYDKIVRAEPDFEEAAEARSKLYSKILTEARNLYQEGLIYESVGDLDLAAEDYQKTKELLTNVRDPNAAEYYRRTLTKLRHLQK